MQSEQVRQPLWPEPGMSDTLLTFAEPVIELLPNGHGPEELKAMLRFAALIWNTIVEQQEEIDDEVVLAAREITRGLQEPAPEVFTRIQALVQRKVDYFHDDVRMVLAIDVTRDGKGLHVRASSD